MTDEHEPEDRRIGATAALALTPFFVWCASWVAALLSDPDISGGYPVGALYWASVAVFGLGWVPLAAIGLALAVWLFWPRLRSVPWLVTTWRDAVPWLVVALYVVHALVGASTLSKAL